MSAVHGRSQGHGGHEARHDTHEHGAGASSRRLAAALAITGIVLVAEVVTAALTGSLALLADAGHMATDAAGLAVALLAARLATRPATDRSTWGLRRAEIIGAAVQAGALALVGVLVAVRAVGDLVSPPVVEAGGMLVMGVIGLLANLVSLAVLASGRGSSLNARAAFLEVVNDALGSVGVLLAALVISTTGWYRADAVVSLLIAALIVPRAAVLLRSAGAVLLELTPRELDLSEVRRHLEELDGVTQVHDLHAWTVASGLPVLTAHLVVEDSRIDRDRAHDLLDELEACVAEHFPVRIEHTTFQLEPAGHDAHEPECCAGA